MDAVRKREKMQLRMMTDYAIRILIYMQMVGKAATRQEISAAMGITEGPLTLTLRRLRDAGWIESSVGSEGGWRLINEIENVSMLDVMKITEDTIRFNRCLEDDQFCSRNAAAHCPVHEVYKRYQEMTEAYFSAISIADLIRTHETRPSKIAQAKMLLEGCAKPVRRNDSGSHLRDGAIEL